MLTKTDAPHLQPGSPRHPHEPDNLRSAALIMALQGRVGELEHQVKLLEQDVRNLDWRHKSWRQRLLANRLVPFPRYGSIPLRFPKHYTEVRPPAPPPGIAIVTPSYNQGRFLERTLQSVLDQDYPRLEYVVQDGGSTDDSHAILERYQGRLAHCESRKDRGQAHAINLGFAHTHGEIMAYLNSDDLLVPGTLAYVAGYFETHPQVDVVYGHRIVIDENDGEVGRWVLPPHDHEVMRWCNLVPQETLFWRRRIWDRIGAALDEEFHFALDWDMLLRFREAGARFVRLPRFLGAFRIHADQKTLSRYKALAEPENQRLWQRCHGRLPYGAELDQAARPYLFWHAVFHNLYRFGLVRY